MISAVLCTSISDAVFCFNLVLLFISTVVFPFLQLSFGPVGRPPASVALSAGKRQKVGLGGKLEHFDFSLRKVARGKNSQLFCFLCSLPFLTNHMH